MFLSRIAAKLRKFRNFSSTFAASSLVKTPFLTAERIKIFGRNGFGDYTGKVERRRAFQWILLSGQAAIILGIHVSPALAEDVSINQNSQNTSGTEISGLCKVEDGSVISNIHTSKWRIFTDSARDYFLRGNLDEAEKLFLSALQEAKEGFGERDAHVASACNNLAELYRVKKEFGKAEPLYLEAINILEESFGPDDVRVAAALHNLGQFYLIQRKLEQARSCYERALKIKRRILGAGHTDYADTMYHLGTVLYLQGREKDAEVLIQDSIQILEDGGLGESIPCLRRLQYLAQIITQIGKLAKKTSFALYKISTTTSSTGGTKNVCHENAANLLHIARVKMLNSNRLKKRDIPHALAELDKAKNILSGSIRFASSILQSLNALALLEITKLELRESRDHHLPVTEAERIFRQCVSAFKEFAAETSLCNSPEVKAEYLSCMKQLLALINYSPTISSQQSSKALMEQLEVEIKRVEYELSSAQRRPR
ncbi:hypothetical protein M9H77_34103 [Catharanthus roseus]|uniref:Uncharacterized protein n=1 Tax=Catharanthus roseus TaxID=4058 RepID=A0ACB9ZM24_CATRO|nr:hypothetical protein M9H77_34103 [Catharanthus roseus]